MTTLYTCSKFLIKFLLRFYFRRIKIEGLENLPIGRPLLVTPNHQNAFLDAFLVGAFMPVSLHFLTRANVFQWWSKPLLRKLNMIPVYRMRDGFTKLSLNNMVFKTCKQLLSEGQSISIFPESNHGEHYYLRPLTKGTARIAILSQKEIEEDLMVLPVGLNYFDHQAPRSTVLMVFGEPIPVRDYIDKYNENQAEGLITMRDAISKGMKRVLVIPQETNDYRSRKASIFQENNVNLSFRELKEVEVKEQIEVPAKRKHLIAKILNPVPFFIIKKVLSGVEDIVFHASLKFAIGFFVFPIWWLMIFLILYFTIGVHVATLASFVMITGLFHSYQ